MTYKSYSILLFARVCGLLAAALGLAYGIAQSQWVIIFVSAMALLLVFLNTYRFSTKRFIEMDDFFEAVKYRDFSRWFVEDRGPQDMRSLHKGFNLVNKTIKSINSERQAQFLYLQKILAMVDVGIIAFNVETGAVLWHNDSFLKLLDFPSFKNISFVKNRRPEVYDELFDRYHTTATAGTLNMRHENIKVLISDTVFDVEEESFKLVVVQNIEETLDRTESDAWKKLLSVMTHEIMNSIAPISSLAETLENNLTESLEQDNSKPIDIEDVLEGIGSIKKRSTGLMKFAQTYRSLNKVTHINRTEVKAVDLFNGINSLLKPSLEAKAVHLHFQVANPNLILNIDSYLIEQVLINLIVNAIEATEGKENPTVKAVVGTTSKGGIMIVVSDNGMGIPEEIMERIFIPFFSTKKRGSGIGLSLSKQIMTLHRGKIQLRNLKPHGVEARLLF